MKGRLLCTAALALAFRAPSVPAGHSGEGVALLQLKAPRGDVAEKRGGRLGRLQTQLVQRAAKVGRARLEEATLDRALQGKTSGGGGAKSPTVVVKRESRESFEKASAALKSKAVAPPDAKPAEQAEEVDMKGLPVEQSSTFEGGPAKNAIDGNYANAWREGSCTHTNDRAGADPWWKVTLKKASVITSVRIGNRGEGHGDRLNGFSILVDGKPCAENVQIKDGEILDVPCLAKGQEVKVALPGEKKVMTLCEVAVNPKGPPPKVRGDGQ
jgi:hypothetical protein